LPEAERQRYYGTQYLWTNDPSRPDRTVVISCRRVSGLGELEQGIRGERLGGLEAVVPIAPGCPFGATVHGLLRSSGKPVEGLWKKVEQAGENCGGWKVVQVCAFSVRRIVHSKFRCKLMIF